MMKSKKNEEEKKKTAASSKNSRTCAGARMRVSVEKLIECCKRSNGIMSVVATMLGVDWHTADKYIKNCPEAQEAFQSSREAIVDVGESKFLKIVNDEKHPRHYDALVFLLSTIGKKRGFTQKIEQEVSGIKAPPALSIVIEK